MKILTIHFFALFFLSCNSNRLNFDACDNDIENWISEAPEAYNDFAKVKAEVLSNEQFVQEFSANGLLFLRLMDTSKYKGYSMPYLKNWFEKGRGYISIGKSDTTFCYKWCEDGLHTADAYVYYRRKQYSYKSGVQLIDSLYLGQGWFAHVVKCRGCNE